jgi:hypothetical protein
MIGFATQRLMELEVEGLTGAYGEKSQDRLARDSDGVYRPFIRRIRAIGILDRPISAQVVRRDSSVRSGGTTLDYVVVFGEPHLRHLFKSY